MAQKQRITEAMLEAQIERLNRLTGNEAQPIYFIDGAYGGVRLERRTKHDCHEALNTGYTTKRSLYDAVSAFITGIHVGLSLSQPKTKES